MWSLNVSTLAPISTAIVGGMAIGTMSVYANWSDDLELVVPAFQSKKVHNLGKGKGKVSGFLTGVADFATSLTSVPVIGEAASLVSQAAKPLADLASWFGFSRAIMEVAPTRYVGRFLTNVARVDGEDTSDMSALTLACGTSIDPTLVGDGMEDELSLPALEKRWTVVVTSEWTTSQTRGDVIVQFPVSPMYALQHTPLCLTTGGYFALPFQYWRCDMEYELLMPSSVLHQGSLQIIFMPNGSSITTDATNLAFNIIAVIGDNSLIRFSVGYARERPYLPTRIITRDLAIIPYEATAGNIVILVANPLVCQSSAAKLYLTVFARTKNLDVFQPRNTLLWIDSEGVPTNYNLSTDIHYQGLTNEAPEQVSKVLFPGGIVYPGVETCSGERIASLRAVAQKFCPLYKTVANQTDYPNMQVPPNSTALTQYWTWAQHAVAPFVGFAGSERYKAFIRYNTSASIAAVGLSKEQQWSATVIPVMSTLNVGLGTNGSGFEGQVPYSTPKKFVYAREVRTTINGEIVTKLSAYAFNNGTTSMKPFYALGTDLRVNHFRQCPGLYFRVNPQDIWF